MLLIPAIDLKDEKCVRLRQGRMNDVTIFADDPVQMAKRWQSLGAKRLHIVDLNGAFAGKPVNAEVIRNIAANAPHMELQVGGGIRDMATIQAYLDAGVHYVIIGTMAVKDPDFVAAACQKFPNTIIVGLDAKDGRVATDGWAQISDFTVIDLAQRFQSVGVEAIVYTDIGRDGMMTGVNVEATAALAKAITIPVIASGGITTIDDLHAIGKVADTGIMGAITGRAIYEGTLDFAAGLKVAMEY